MNRVKITLVTAIFIAISFTFSACVLNLGNGDGDSSSSGENASSPSGGGDGNSSSGGGVSSSGGGTSSSGGTSGGAYSGEYGSLEYGDKTYKTVVIGDQTWMAENLNYEVDGGKCYGEGAQVNEGGENFTLSEDEIQAYCATYGRLYTWAAAMNLGSGCNSSSCSEFVQDKHQGICPDGWHIPSNDDWDKLYRYADGTDGRTSPYSSSTAGRYLKAASGWNSCGRPSDPSSSYLCEDSFGFAALPGGKYSTSRFREAGNEGDWWSANEKNNSSADRRYMEYNRNDAYSTASYSSYSKSNLISVRCVKD